MAGALSCSFLLTSLVAVTLELLLMILLYMDELEVVTVTPASDVTMAFDERTVGP